MTTFSVNNWRKLTPKRWRDIGDALLISIPLLTGFIMQSPLPDQGKAWAVFIMNIVLVAGKFLTKLFHDERESYPVDDKPIN